MPTTEWRRLKEEVYAKEGRKCYICGSKEQPFSLHEFWEYNDEKHIQRLSAVHHLCNLCHKIKHIGFWCHTADGRMKLKQEGFNCDDLIIHFCTVNNCTIQDFLAHENKAFDMWKERSKYQWKQDFGSMRRSLNNENSI
jgi:hypothetical protein